MGLGTYVREMFTPDRHFEDKEHFWQRYKSRVLTDALSRDEIKAKYNSFESEDEKIAFQNNLESRLETITQENFDSVWTKYESNKSSVTTAARYAGLGANILGGITAAGSILAFAAGGPLTLLAGAAYGLGLLTVGAVTNTLADVQDAYDLGSAVTEAEKDPSLRIVKNEEESSGGVWGYLKRTVSGAWESVKSYFTGTYENSKNAIKYGASSIAEGALVNSSYSIPGYLLLGQAGSILGSATPIAQSVAFGTSALAFYSGRKKFDDKLTNYIIDRSLDDLVDVEQGNEPQGIRSNIAPSRIQPLEHAYATEPIYAAMNQAKRKPLGLVAPRAA